MGKKSVTASSSEVMLPSPTFQSETQEGGKTHRRGKEGEQGFCRLWAKKRDQQKKHEAFLGGTGSRSVTKVRA